MTKTLGKQKASKTITTSLSSINIHYQSRDSPSFKSIFQTWHNCSRLSPPPPCLQSLLHSTRAFDDRGFNRRSLERSINDRSTRARDGTLPFRFFDDVCRKIKWRHPTYDYDFDESSWKRGTNKKKKKKRAEFSNSRVTVCDRRYRSAKWKSRKRRIVARGGVIGSWTVSWLRGREGGGRDRQVSSLEGLTQWKLSFRNLARLLSLFIDELYEGFFFFFLSRVLRWCFDDGDGAREFRACASRLARGESFETKYFIEIFWWIRCRFKEKWNFIYGSR